MEKNLTFKEECKKKQKMKFLNESTHTFQLACIFGPKFLQIERDLMSVSCLTGILDMHTEMTKKYELHSLIFINELYFKN